MKRKITGIRVFVAALPFLALGSWFLTSHADANDDKPCPLIRTMDEAGHPTGERIVCP